MLVNSNTSSQVFNFCDKAILSRHLFIPDSFKPFPMLCFCPQPKYVRYCETIMSMQTIAIVVSVTFG